MAIENISQGICFFGVDERLILCNRRYAEIYRIEPDELRRGLTLSEIIERRVAAGTSAMPPDAYLAMARSVNSGNASKVEKNSSSGLGDCSGSLTSVRNATTASAPEIRVGKNTMRKGPAAFSQVRPCAQPSSTTPSSGPTTAPVVSIAR
nr:PAS-domain containing protein [Mesorhizobium amorphae]